MPQKLLSQPRTWGTRFDSFISSDASPPRSPQPETIETTAVLDAAMERVSDKPKDQRMPHDASIFVGSLPANMDQAELSRLLADHLADHTEVKYVKVIRDSKGGACAFVQCEDAPSAARLVYTLNTTPVKPFLGRYLRYEPARAFRTLLVSYRTPMQYVDAEASSNDSSHEKKRVELELPTVMKLWRNRNSKYLSILYNDEATASESSQDEYAASRGCGLYLSPLSFDAETIHKIALTFGPVEQFTSYGTDTSSLNIPSAEHNEDAPNANLDEKEPYPSPHDGPRATAMDDGCWEIKWGHRDDAVSALITLRRVPHLTVTWAHQPNYLPFEQPSSPQVSHFSHPSGLPYPIRVASQSSPIRMVGSTGLTTSVMSPSSVKSLFLPLPPTAEKKKLTIQTSTISDSANDVFSSNSASTAADDKWNKVQASEWAAPLSPSPSVKNSSGAIPSLLKTSEMSPTQKKPELTDKDFPPLGLLKGEQKAGGGYWGDRQTTKNESEAIDEPPSIGSTSPQLSTLATPRASTIEIPIPQEVLEAALVPADEDEQELDIPATPDFGMSPNTPKTTGSMMFPHTPGTYTFGVHSPPSKDIGVNVVPPYIRDEIRGESEIDPTSIFVGGLEMNGPRAWDEERVKGFFSKFGGVEDVKVIFPTGGRSAFAFVKFDNTEAPSRAVFQEHNRLHDGRPMRVQLRDRNPPRGIAWRYGRGRGKYSHSGLPRHYVDSAGIVSQETSFEKNGKSDPPDQILEANSANEGNASPVAITYPTLLEHSNDGAKDLDVLADISNNFTNFGSDVSPSPDGHKDVLDRVETPEPTSIEYPRSSHMSPQSAHTRDAPSQYEGQEWNRYTDTSAPLTPAPSSYASSVSTASSIPYPVPNMGYYQPQPWMAPFGQQFPYPMPYVPGYPGYPLPSQQMPQSFTSPSSSESSRQSTGAQVPWAPNGGVYPAFVPYSAYTQPHHQQPSAQAPLVPTGFIQGEQGTLIPVYQPEALDQYMTSGTQQTSAPPSQSQTQNPSAWGQYPPAPTFPFFPVPQASQTTSHSGNIGWIPNQPPLMLSAGQQSGGPPFRGGHRMGQPGQHHASSRRHRQSTYDRNIPTRPPHARYTNGGMNNTEQTFNVHSIPEQGRPSSFIPHLAFNGIAGVASGWNQWSGGR